ncbi:MAG: hypothetical protein ACYC7A_19095 [Thermoanaerobaculia bacterium]
MAKSSGPMIPVERVQTGIRIERRILKVLKSLADLEEITLGDLIEGIVLHAFEGKAPFGDETLRQIDALKKVFGLDLDAASSHRLSDPGDTLDSPSPRRAKRVARPKKTTKR